MLTENTLSLHPNLDADLSSLREILREYRPRCFAVRFWDGTTWQPDPEQEARFTLVLKHPGALRQMFWKPSRVTLGEAYVHDVFDIEGDIEASISLCEYLLGQRRGMLERLRVGWELSKFPFPRGSDTPASRLRGACHSKERDLVAVTSHYDVSTKFYKLWLDRHMVYSCGYFANPNASLDTAQEQKLDYICRKLRLSPNEKLLDIGCGWGGLLMHAAQHYGVKAIGITLSEPQAKLARERIVQAGLTDRCQVHVCDYRDLESEKDYDKLVSVGMVEHVGEALLPEYFSRAWNVLRPGGLFLNHGITSSPDWYNLGGSGFIRTYVFPDSELPPVGTLLQISEKSGFEVRDMESLREHYVMTLRAWVRRLEGRQQEAVEEVGEETYRIWRLYMAGAAHCFAKGRLNVYQTLLLKPDGGRSKLPLTRRDWYV
jgi:cyclopropane-fatty-acyl-phospholipid synthase